MYRYNNIILLIILLISITLFIKKEHFSSSSNIPKKIFLSYKTKNIPEYILKNWSSLNPGYEINLYDNDDCKQFLLENYTKEHVRLFDFLQDGPIKADFWRVCVLYKYGGVYSDIDIQLLVPIDYIINIEPYITFITCNSIGGTLNPHFIITEKENQLLKKCIDQYMYKWKSGEEYSYWGYSITGILYKIFQKYVSEDVSEGIYIDRKNKKNMIISEVGSLNNLKEIYCSYKKQLFFYNRYASYNSDMHTF
jgi:mannosyltransferase OCH1-like enzyme